MREKYFKIYAKYWRCIPKFTPNIGMSRFLCYLCCKISLNMSKARQIVSEIDSLKDSKSVRIIVLTGARQVGKTTIVKEKMKEYGYLSIEDPVLRGSYASLTADQWHALYPMAALDEVQKEPRLIESIKSVYDQYDDTRYVLLGSSQLLLLGKVRESLAGRCRILNVYPLTLPELRTSDWDDTVKPSLWQRLLSGEDLKGALLPSFLLDPDHAAKSIGWEHLLRFGGYPALVDETLSDEDRYRWLGNYVRTYLERDVRDIASFRDLEPFVKLQREIAALTGQVLNASSVANSLRLSSKTVQRYVSYLDLSYQTVILPAWSRNIEKRLSKAPKVHFMDFGVQQAILNKRGGMTGHEFESLLVSELFKQARNILAPVSFFHIRTQDGREVDLIVETPEGYFAFEIKMSENVTGSDARHLKKLSGLLDKPVIGSFILSNDPQTKDFQDGIKAVSAPMFLG